MNESERIKEVKRWLKYAQEDLKTMVLSKKRNHFGKQSEKNSKDEM